MLGSFRDLYYPPSPSSLVKSLNYDDIGRVSVDYQDLSSAAILSLNDMVNYHPVLPYPL